MMIMMNKEKRTHQAPFHNVKDKISTLAGITTFVLSTIGIGVAVVGGGASLSMLFMLFI